MSRVIIADALTGLGTLESESVDCVVTSPPYLGLRDYQVAGQLGHEKTPQEYVAALVAIFREVRRVLKPTGNVWLNLGDSYNSNAGFSRCTESFKRQGREGGSADRKAIKGLKEKDLIGIPWRVALALQEPYIVPSCVKSEIDRAWLAAMFDGEGCIGIRRFDSYRKELQQKYQDGFVVYTTIANNDTELLNRCVEITGIGSVRIKQKAGNTDNRGILSRHDNYGWRLDGNKAIDIIKAIYPYLIAKRKQACLAYTLDLINKDKHRVNGCVPQEYQDKKVALYEMIKKCNQRETVDIPDWVKEPKQEIEPGWYLRSDIIWHKPNPMPESVTDRPTRSHEYIFLLTKSARYWYDQEAIREAQAPNAEERYRYKLGGDKNESLKRTDKPTAVVGKREFNPAGRNARDVWTITTKGYKEAHFATFPPDIPTKCILAGCPSRVCSVCGKPWVNEVERGELRPHPQRQSETPAHQFKADNNCYEDGGTLGKTRDINITGINPICSCAAPYRPGVVLDPFAGSGTTGMVAKSLGREYILIELNPKYEALIQKRLDSVQSPLEGLL